MNTKIAIKKVSTPKKARDFFGSLLEDKILCAPKIDIRDIYRDYNNFAQSVKRETSEGDVSYLKPSTLKAIANYKEPYSMQSYKSTLIWNALFPNDSIREFTSFRIADLLPTIPPLEIHKKNSRTDEVTIEDNSKEFYEFLDGILDEVSVERLEKMFDEHPPMRKHGLKHIAIPLETDTIPEWLLPLVDSDLVVNSVLSKGNILLESLGFTLLKSRKYQTPSNIIEV